MVRQGLVGCGCCSEWLQFTYGELDGLLTQFIGAPAVLMVLPSYATGQGMVQSVDNYSSLDNWTKMALHYNVESADFVQDTKQQRYRK